ncbi:MAG: hypothetical protein JWQ06_838 [Mucilaginibacter sp.]|nr:hypothetical protein [Mucilaginibacter sp.]
MKKKNSKSEIKLVKKQIETSLVTQLKNVTEKLGEGTKKLSKKIEKGSKKLAKKIAKEVKLTQPTVAKDTKPPVKAETLAATNIVPNKKVVTKSLAPANQTKLVKTSAKPVVQPEEVKK